MEYSRLFCTAIEVFMDIKKTNAARILDRHKISYELIPYKVDENDLGAQHVADSLACHSSGQL